MKTKRQAKIIEIISNTNVETQEQLLKALEEAAYRNDLVPPLFRLGCAEPPFPEGKTKWTPGL